MAVNTDEKAIDRLLNLGVADVIVKEDLKKKLMSGKQLRIKLGIDPTGFDLHLGHMVVVHKLKEFQDLGHQIILLFGNFTGKIGDPSGKNETRPMRTQEELEANAKDYMKQAAYVLDVSKVEVRWNAEWLAPLNFADVVHLASQFTVAQMLERDMFQDRIKAGQPISMHEFMYPLMQGYDSVALKADVELGGTDQTFNILAGRTLQKAYDQEPQNVLTVPILIGTDGSMKMGKSTGNYIAVDEKPEDLYGKTMSIPDTLILNYFELAARKDGEALAEVAARLKGGENPRNLKMELAYELVKLYRGENEALRAQEHFKTVHQKKEIPDEIESVFLDKPMWNIVDLIFELKLASTKSDARRLVEGGGVKLETQKIEDISTEITLKNEPILMQVGKRQFRKVCLKLTSDILNVVIEDLTFLRDEWDNEVEDSSLRITSPILRRLLVDNDLQKAWKIAGFFKEPKISTNLIENIISNTKKEDVFFAATCGAKYKNFKIDGVFLEIQKSGAVRDESKAKNSFLPSSVVNLSDFVNATCMIIRGKEINRRTLIQYVANKLGGTHYDVNRSDKDKEEIYPLLDWAFNECKILEKRSIYFELLSIGQKLINSPDVKKLLV